MAEKGLKKNLSWTAVGMVLYNLAIWFLSAMILRMLGATMSGYYAVATSIGNTLYAVALWGMRSFIVSDQKKEFSFEEYLGARLAAISISAAVLVIVLFATHYDSLQIVILILYSGFKFTEALIEVLDCFMQQQKQMEINAKSMILRSALFIAGFWAILAVTHSLAAGLAGILICSLAVFFFYNLRRVRAVTALKEVVFTSRTVQIIKDCLPIMLFEMLAAAVVAIPRLRFQAIGSLDALGIYTSIYTMVVFLQLAINIFIFTFAPYMAEAWQKPGHEGFRRYLLLLFGGSAGLGLLAEILVLLLGRPVIGLLFGAEAAPYYTYLYIGILSGVTLAWTWIFSQLFTILRRMTDLLICSAVSTISCVLFSNALVNAADCNTMSLALIGTNLVFIAAAAAMLALRRKGKAE